MSSFPNSIALFSNLSTTGVSSANLKFNRAFQGVYFVQYSWLADGDIPIVYSGVDYVGLALASDPNTVIPIILQPLASDVQADIATWFGNSLAAACIALGTSIASISFLDNTMQVVFNDDVIFYSSGIYSGKYLFGNQNIASVGLELDIPLKPEIFNVRPKFLGVICPEADSMFGQSRIQNINMVISTIDTPFVNYRVNFPDTTDEVNLTIVRLNAPDIECPITMEYGLILSRSV